MEPYYELLEVTSTTPMKKIKKQYIKLMRKTHPDRTGQDEQCKKITEAYQKIVQYKLNLKCDENNLIPIGFTEMGFENNPLPMEYVRRKIELSKKIQESNKELETNVILELKDIQRKKKSMFEKMFDFFFEYEDSSDESEGE
tara:strand:+ start:48 stop:473 length:426 start_codon:yes stop_codon:yes gene_type:complete